eukprot:8628327-Alexandrium_andersonii.AAC.1
MAWVILARRIVSGQRDRHRGDPGGAVDDAGCAVRQLQGQGEGEGEGQGPGLPGLPPALPPLPPHAQEGEPQCHV